MKKIKLTQGQYAIVDEEDFKWLSQHKWCITSEGYAHCYKGGYMHRMINKTPEGLITDHIDGNRLNNSRANLRTVDKSVNAINSGLRTNNKSGYKGVSLSKLHKKWEAYIWKNNKKFHLGLFNEMNEAIEARKQAEEIYHA